MLFTLKLYSYLGITYKLGKMIRISALTFLFSWAILWAANAQTCTDCETLRCDGINCDDGTAADGVQTSRNCSCGKEISGACAYVEFDLNLNPYFNPNDPTCSLIFRSQESGNFNIYFLDDFSCTINDCSVPDFVVSSETTFNNIPTSGILRAIICKNGGNAGRRDFTFSISCTSVENCVNNVDDNNDAWVDCDDSQCTTDQACTYSDTSSSNDGGLESNGRLAELIARRNYLREKEHTAQNIKQYQKVFTESNTGGYAFRVESVFQLKDIIATDLVPKNQTFISTPHDLIEMTNAHDVLGIDIYNEDKRNGSILATKSSNVYEHTKNICDRLNGAQIDQIGQYIIGDIPFVVIKFINSYGQVEYNVNFSFYDVSDHEVVLESHWNLSDYPKGKTYYNYQVWANNLTNLETMINSMMKKLTQQKTIRETHIGQVPKVYVKTVIYQNHKLNLVLEKPAQLLEIKLKGLFTQTEQDFEQSFEYTIAYPSDTITVDFGNFYGIGISLYNSLDHTPDAIYFADGSWGLDYEVGDVFIKKFRIYNEPNPDFKLEDKLIERNIEVEAIAKSGFAIYRAINAAYHPEDFTSFHSFDFRVKGKGKLELVFIKDEIKDWEMQPRQFFELKGKTQAISVRLKSLSVPLNDIKMVAFKYHTNSTPGQDPTYLTLNNLKFVKSEATALFESENLTVYPNPANHRTTLSYLSDGEYAYKITLLDTNGKAVYLDYGDLEIGNNYFTIENGFQNGLYLLTLDVEGAQQMESRIVFRK